MNQSNNTHSNVFHYIGNHYIITSCFISNIVAARIDAAKARGNSSSRKVARIIDLKSISRANSQSGRDI